MPAAIASMLAFTLSAFGACPASAEVPSPTAAWIAPGAGSLTLHWQVTSTDGLAGFRVRSRPVFPFGHAWSGGGELPRSARSYKFTGLAVEPYELKVRALLIGGRVGGVLTETGNPFTQEEVPEEPPAEEPPSEEPPKEEPPTEEPREAATGRVRLIKDANTSFDAVDIELNAPWINDTFERMIAYSTWFDKNLGWYKRALVYDDAYAIGRGGQEAAEHPEWIARDQAGNKLYIPWGCSGGTCPQYAGDISNAAFRAHWITELKSVLQQGYVGVFVDDVDMWANTSNGSGTLVAPIDHDTGQPMTDEEWRSYMASLMAELRKAIPDYQIMENQVWYQGGGPKNANVAQALQQANWTMIEHGIADGGVTGGTGEFSVYHLLNYVDEVHALGTAVDMDGDAETSASMEYTLAGYFLINDGKDLVQVNNSQTVGDLWPGWGVNLGEAEGERTRASDGLFERRFTKGLVYLNEPGATSKTITLPEPMLNTSDELVKAVTLGAKSAAVLRTQP